MPYIKGKKLSEHLDNFPLEKQKEILKVVGQETSKLHDNDIIHGDLTTSNLILVEGKNDNERNDEVNDNERLINNKQRDKSSTLTILKRSIMTKSDAKQSIIYFLDFGLGFISKKVEDKAVDLHLIKQALEAKHFRNWETLFNEFLKGYDNSKEASKVLERLKVVEKGGDIRINTPAPRIYN